MKKIPSFTIDHIRLLRGIYVSRQDEVNGETVTTFDIRMKEPNREPALGQGALHTIEHLAATYLRNDPQWQDKIIYWGPMGCLTGNYLLMKGDLKPQDILALMQDTFRFVAEYEGEVPGTAPQDCGNYLLHDLPMAKWESAKYLHEVLEQMKEENMKYPEKEEKTAFFFFFRGKRRGKSRPFTRQNCRKTGRVLAFVQLYPYPQICSTPLDMVCFTRSCSSARLALFQWSMVPTR